MQRCPVLRVVIDSCLSALEGTALSVRGWKKHFCVTVFCLFPYSPSCSALSTQCAAIDPNKHHSTSMLSLYAGHRLTFGSFKS